VAAALSPAKVESVEIVDLAGHAARVVVPDYQLSLAIGKEGQNARLAAKLTGWRIDIRPDVEAPAVAGGRNRPAPASEVEAPAVTDLRDRPAPAGGARA
jgi:transcription termination/antitermination protein NusA